MKDKIKNITGLILLGILTFVISTNASVSNPPVTSNLVPYTGATGNVNLGTNSITAANIFASSTWLKVANNLSDLVSTSSARSNLGLTDTATLASSTWIKYVTPSTSGNVLTSNGTIWTSAAIAAGVSFNQKVHTQQSGSGGTNVETLVGSLATTTAMGANDTLVLGFECWGDGAGTFRIKMAGTEIFSWAITDGMRTNGELRIINRNATNSQYISGFMFGNATYKGINNVTKTIETNAGVPITFTYQYASGATNGRVEWVDAYIIKGS